MSNFKRRLVLVLVFLLVCPLVIQASAEKVTAAQPAVYVQINEVVYPVAPVNIRTGPGTEHPIIGALRPGHCLRRLAIGSHGWSKVMFRGEVAYIHSSYLTAHCPEGSFGLNEAELQKQFAGVSGLNQQAYTTQSMEAVNSAVDQVCEALGSADPNAVDAAVQDLKNAIAALVPMDYAALEASLSEIQALDRSNTESALWLKLMEAEQNGKALLTSGDQAAVDAASRQIRELLTQLKELPEPQADPEIIVQQVPVEVPPSEDFCNTSVHGVWPILFFISLGWSVVLSGIILLYILKKKHRQRDNTPLVDYDISDDT